MSQNKLLAKYGAHYFEASQNAQYTSPESHLYFFEAFIGTQEMNIQRGDCVFTVSPTEQTVTLNRGPKSFLSSTLSVVIRGYMPEHKVSSTKYKTTLPYVNGCSTKQLIPPDRLGDPTLQMLHMPPFTKEQQHHIHSTSRVVYVLSGKGESVVGMGENIVKTELRPGIVCILEPMCPHHFETTDDELIVLPIHVWSSVGLLEKNHPMFNGTHLL